MEFASLLNWAKLGDKLALERLARHFGPLLSEYSEMNGAVDPDLFQEQCVVLIKCLYHFTQI